MACGNAPVYHPPHKISDKLAVANSQRTLAGPSWRSGGPRPGPHPAGRPHLTLTARERNAFWDHATRAAADATAQIRNLAWTNPAAADAA